MSKLKDFGKDFDASIASGVAVVDFWATWCGPCKMLAPIIDEVAESIEGVNFGQVDVDVYPQIALKYNVNSIPNVCLFKDGQLVDRSIGLVDVDELTEFIKNHI
ncbi:MAG: thioredoxin [Clostridia bacterium]|nr:thioredoxin [Clostridia bacterium]